MSSPLSAAAIKNLRRMIQSMSKSCFGSTVRGLSNFWIGYITNETRRRCKFKRMDSTSFAFIDSTKSGGRTVVAGTSFHKFSTDCPVIAKVTVVSRRCFDRSSDSIGMFVPIFSVISAIAEFSTLWRKFAQIGSGASWMTLPSRVLHGLQAGGLSELLLSTSCRSGIFFEPAARVRFGCVLN
jgi:hypothetical protein